MEGNALRCNVAECGEETANGVVVTGCLHAICLQCAGNYGLDGPLPAPCPACQKTLEESEIMVQNLQVSEDWKSIVMCGHDPTTMMEATGRAITFWSYHMSQKMSTLLPSEPVGP
ncbi:hypothetical protein QBC35DRAFT_480346 [Podospora australis]|uniref:RING-type domain-containing protein n=1 Tax=Podospora australis TaxID=1536484 RepID=A0AAN7APM5_9PEZI|nr:hypothetical protein QBC35DRAFT_480346 [Podospora australis]